MEPDESLRSWIARESPVPVWRAASIGRRVAEAVAARHAEGRSAASSLDPETIQISFDSAGAPLVRLPPGGAGDTTAVLDPAEDMPPLGAVLYELLTGMAPPARRAPPPVQRARPDLPESFGWLVMQCFHPGPAGRPRSADEVARRLTRFEEAGTDASVAAPPPPAVEWPPRPSVEPTPILPRFSDPDFDLSKTRPIPMMPELKEPAAPSEPSGRHLQVFAPMERGTPTPPVVPPAPVPEAEPRPAPPPPPPSLPPKTLEDKTLARESTPSERVARESAPSVPVVARESVPPVRDEPLPPSEEERRRSHPLVIWSVAALLAAAAAAGIWIVIQTAGRSPAPSFAAARRPATPVPTPVPTEAPPTPFPVVEVSPAVGAASVGAGAASAVPTSAPTSVPTAPRAPATPVAPRAAAAAPTPALTGRSADEETLRETLDEWIASTNRRDLSGNMRFYMPKVATFYLAHDVTRDFVWEEKSRLFAAGSLEVHASSPEIELSADGRSATMRFRKRYMVPGKDGERRGEVLQEMRWVKTPRGWRIVAERDARELSRE